MLSRMTPVIGEVAPSSSQRLLNERSALKTSEEDFVADRVKAKGKVLDRLLQWC